MDAVNHGYASVNGIRLHYAESGGGDKLVILLHGFPEFWYSWRHQLTALAADYHVVAPDMRGYNLSDKPRRVGDYRVDVLVEDVIGLIRHFGANHAAIVAHDWGAGVAWKLAAKYPEHLSKIAIMQVPPAAAWRKNITVTPATEKLVYVSLSASGFSRVDNQEKKLCGVGPDVPGVSRPQGILLRR